MLSDTIRNIRSSISLAPPILTSPDSFLLGELATANLGLVKADILTQFAAPEGFQYPDSSELDSVCIYMSYSYYVGDGKSPLRITAYALDGEVMEYQGKYLCTEPVSRFCSMDDSTHVTAQDAILEAAIGTGDSITRSDGSTTSIRVRMRLNDNYARKIFAIKKFGSQQDFNKLFKGLYITTNFGTGTMLYVVDIAIGIHYHYYYRTETGTYARQRDTKYWYANDEVRRINRYDSHDIVAVDAALRQDSFVNYITSPLGFYTRLTIPMKEIREQVLERVGGKRPYVNLANLRIDILNHDSEKTFAEDWGAPAPTMLLIKEDAFDRFFYEDAVVSDTCAMYSETYQETDSVTALKRYYYKFSMASLLTQYLRDTVGNLADTLQMLMVPIDIKTAQTSSNTSIISSITQKQTWTITSVRSSVASDEPLDIEIVYSGFSNVSL